jgi:hypothetical protein
MATVSTEDLEAQRDGLNRLLRGYRALINSPDTDQTAKNELNEGIANNTRDLNNVEAILATINKAINDGTFAPKKEIASEEVIAALKRLADDVLLVPADFEMPTVLADNLNVTVE